MSRTGGQSFIFTTQNEALMVIGVVAEPVFNKAVLLAQSIGIQTNSCKLV